jgi:hypothetical protein
MRSCGFMAVERIYREMHQALDSGGSFPNLRELCSTLSVSRDNRSEIRWCAVQHVALWAGTAARLPPGERHIGQLGDSCRARWLPVGSELEVNFLRAHEKCQ